MLPDKIEIKYLNNNNGELEEVTGEFYYQFNFNAINSFRKEEGMSFEDFQNAFDGIENGDFDSIERIGKLFFHALKEGGRRTRTPFPLSLEDVIEFMNSDTENFTKVIGVYGDSLADADESSKKK